MSKPPPGPSGAPLPELTFTEEEEEEEVDENVNALEKELLKLLRYRRHQNSKADLEDSNLHIQHLVSLVRNNVALQFRLAQVLPAELLKQFKDAMANRTVQLVGYDPPLPPKQLQFVTGDTVGDLLHPSGLPPNHVNTVDDALFAHEVQGVNWEELSNNELMRWLNRINTYRRKSQRVYFPFQNLVDGIRQILAGRGVDVLPPPAPPPKPPPTFPKLPDLTTPVPTPQSGEILNWLYTLDWDNMNNTELDNRRHEIDELEEDGIPEQLLRTFKNKIRKRREDLDRAKWGLLMPDPRMDDAVRRRRWGE
jgi:hypothetical protein